MDVTAKLDVGDNITLLLNKLGEKMGVGVDHFWPILVKQQVYSGVFELLLALILFGLASLIIWKSSKWSEGDTNIQSIFFGISFLLLFFSFCTFIIPNPTMHIINPEYYALQEVLSQLK